MGTPHEPDPARLFVAVMCGPAFDAAPVAAELLQRFGPVQVSCGPLAFGFTEYYESEMGSGLLKCYQLYARPFDRGLLADVKVVTNAIESRYVRDGKRAVNIDPGYLCRDKLVLASTKDFYHRLYLGQGMFGEVTLHFSKGAWREFAWTYPDYQQPEVLGILTTARAALAGEARRRRAGDAFSF
jgi:hypothetical protein